MIVSGVGRHHATPSARRDRASSKFKTAEIWSHATAVEPRPNSFQASGAFTEAAVTPWFAGRLLCDGFQRRPPHETGLALPGRNMRFHVGLTTISLRHTRGGRRTRHQYMSVISCGCSIRARSSGGTGNNSRALALQPLPRAERTGSDVVRKLLHVDGVAHGHDRVLGGAVCGAR